MRNKIGQKVEQISIESLRKDTKINFWQKYEKTQTKRQTKIRRDKNMPKYFEILLNPIVQKRETNDLNFYWKKQRHKKGRKRKYEDKQEEEDWK